MKCGRFVANAVAVGMGLGLVPIRMAAEGATTNDWENLAVNSISRLPARTYAAPLASVASALTDRLTFETPYVRSLDGSWKFAWTGDPALREKDFYRTDYDDSRWFDIDVPSCVELRGYGVPIYANTDYPHKREYPFVRDLITGEANYNPVASYRTRFTVPENWRGRRVVLRFEGVYSAYYVWVNGQKVGYAEDSCLPSEFDITHCLRAEGENLLAVEVYRWCDGSYLEDQDMTRYSGIYRGVQLMAEPLDGIGDFAVRTHPAGGYERWRIEVASEGEDWSRTSAALYDADGNKVCDLRRTEGAGGSRPATCEATLPARMWSAEDPYLYTLVIRKGADIRARRVGFKEQRIDGRRVLVNGRPIKFKGVNRHETSADNGRTVTLAEMVRDVELMKRHNVNTVRTCHYPDHRLWYDLCDRYGLYVVAEANVEGHGYWYGEEGLGNRPEWAPSIVERNVRHTVFYRNHPCVVFWSMGNETGHGDGFRQAMAAVRRLDPTRFVHFERGNRDADIDSTMYPFVDWLAERGKAGDGLRPDAPEVEWEVRHGYDNPQTANKPYFSCEYAHAMGNAMGNLKEYWDVFYAYESLAGGCIWDWADQAVWKETDRLDPRTGRRERFLAYGADFDEPIKAGNFNCNGVVDALRNVTPKLVEVAHVYRNLVVRRKDGGFELENRFGFLPASDFDCTAELLVDGECVRTMSVAVPDIAPLARGPLPFAAPAPPAGRETAVNFVFRHRRATRWAEKGWVVARDQIVLSTPEPCAKMDAAPAERPVVDERAATVTASCAGTKAVFSRATGTLCELVMNGVAVLKDSADGLTAGPRLTCARAFTDNDIRMRTGASWSKVPEEKLGFFGSGLSQLRYHARPIEVGKDFVRTTVEVTGGKSAGYAHEAVWRFRADGAITVEQRMVPHGRFPKWVPRLGLSLRLDPALERMRYYGRGPWENYIDRCSASFLGIYSGTVEEQFVDYVRPQDNGGKTDVRWVEFTDARDRGVRFSASEPLFVQALHYGWEDLEFARHRGGEHRFRAPLVRQDDVLLNLDVRQYGLGGNSCGPTTMPQYEFDPNEPVAWTLRIEPAKGGARR